MVPLPAVALEVSNAELPAQNEALPVMLAVGRALIVTTNAPEVKAQLLLLVTVTV